VKVFAPELYTDPCPDSLEFMPAPEPVRAIELREDEKIKEMFRVSKGNKARFVLLLIEMRAPGN
jgi:hypothetical protein